MNELGAKKLAEVAAFTQLSGEILARSGDNFVQAAPRVAAGLQRAHEITVRQLVPAERLELFDAKASKTVAKLTNMMELYIGDEWDNPIEVLEWTSFFAGAAAAHCAIAGSPAAGTDHQAADDLISLRNEFRGVLDAVIDQLSALA